MVASNAETMAHLWRDVLKTAPIEARSDFFEVGGSSLDAVRLAVEIETTFGVALELEDFFDHPTVDELARLVASRQPHTIAGPDHDLP